MSIFNYKERPSYFDRLKEVLNITKEDLFEGIDALVGREESPITETQLEDLESILIQGDLGVETTFEILDQIREQTRSQRVITGHQVKRLISGTLKAALQLDSPPSEPVKGQLHVVFVVGVNGVGKTTTIGKLAHQFKAEGFNVLLAAGDTFRAAAIEQLEIWASRVGSELIKQHSGSDAAAVVHDAISAAKARGTDVLIVDTAGRLHTKDNLMRELEKMKRVASKECSGAPHETYLVLDGTTGQNGLIQARNFVESVGVSGLVVTKLDGTAKGGIVVAISRQLHLPIRFIGVGEGMEDLLPFSSEAFVDSLLGA